VQKVVVALKVLHKSLEKTLASGLEQTRAYMDTCGTREGHLVIFNRDPDIPGKTKSSSALKHTREWISPSGGCSPDRLTANG